MNFDIPEVVRNFQFEGELQKIIPWRFGHINDTYILHFKKEKGLIQRYILQRINQNVFKHPEQLMSNVERVTAHLRQKILSSGGDPRRETLNLISTKNGSAFHKTKDCGYWRAYDFIEAAKTYEIPASPEHVYKAAKAFGKFQKQLSDFPAASLFETIPNFHHTQKRFEAFIQAVKRDAMNRAKNVCQEIEFVKKREAETGIIVNLLEKGELPTRVTHNDTKFNNVMIDDATGEAICIIDLDTVMPGSSLYDFGDLVRSSASPAAEDEKDLSKIFVDLGIFERIVSGFLESAGDILTPSEIKLLPFGAKLMTFECGMRFLTDYLEGDVYFRIHREGQNLDRCRTQFRMVAEMEEKSERLRKIVEERCQSIFSIN